MEFKEDTLKQLFSAAKDSSYGAYCPYSKFRVGAALLIPEQKFQNENIVTGCNVENASFGLCICAEKVAMCKAISLGLLNPDDANDYTNLSIAIYSPDATEPVTPCGACRQFLDEFSPSMRVYCLCEDKESKNLKVSCHVLSDLLPFHFGPNHLPSVELDKEMPVGVGRV